jgi:hypothetical protein
MSSYKINLKSLILVIIIATFWLSGCGAKRARDVKFSGFLGDYSLLEKQRDQDSALYGYRNPKADWPSYSKILLDPIEIWRRAELEKKGAPMEDLQRLANNFYLILHKELSKDYEMVKVPSPRTMRIKVALTDVEESWAAMDTVTSIIPIGIVISAGQEFATGKPSFAGEVSAEIKVTDGRTGQLLAAGVDRRVGGNEIEASVNNWDDANRIIEIWSKIVRFRLCKFRGGKDCLKP